jgi:hypothetical protein
MVMNKKELTNYLSYLDQEIMLMDGFEEAFIGLSKRCGQPILATYSFSKMVQILIDRDGLDEMDAAEYIDYNCTGAWMGELTPIVVEDLYV